MKKLLIEGAVSFRQEQHFDGDDDNDHTDEDSDGATTQKSITLSPLFCTNKSVNSYYCRWFYISKS